jgi:hypothetical protein
MTRHEHSLDENKLCCRSLKIKFSFCPIFVIFEGRIWYCAFPVRVRLKSDGTRWRTGGEVKGKLANGVGSQYSHTTSEHGVSSITYADAHTSATSSRLNWHPRRFKWTRPFRRETKYGFCACAITFQTHYTTYAAAESVISRFYGFFGVNTLEAYENLFFVFIRIILQQTEAYDTLCGVTST